MSEFYWDPHIEHICQSRKVNYLGFYINEMSESDTVVIGDYVDRDENYNQCDFINPVYDPRDEFDRGVKIKSFVLKHHSLPTNIIGFFEILLFDSIFNRTSDLDNKCVLMYVISRCSFSLWPENATFLSELSGGKRVNVGDIMSLYIDAIGRKYAHDNGVEWCLLFNTSLTSAIEHHEKNGWREGAFEQLDKLNALSIVKHVMNFDEDTSYMYKYVNTKLCNLGI